MVAGGSYDWVFTMLGGLVAAAGLMLGVWALFWDRAKRRGVVRRRCPKCWYDMAGVPGLTCPECGKAATGERMFARARRKFRWVGLAAMIVVAGYGVSQFPAYRDGGWVRLVPSSILVRIAPIPQDGSRGSFGPRSGAFVRSFTFSESFPAPSGVANIGGGPNTTSQRQIRSRVIATPPLVAQPPRRPRAISRQLTDEVWRRFSAAELRAWQASVLLGRRFRAAGVECPWAIELPPRWPVDRPMSVNLAVHPNMWDLVGGLTAEFSFEGSPDKGHHGLWHPGGGVYLIGVATPRALGRQTLTLRLRHNDRFIYRTSLAVPVTVVADDDALLLPVDSETATNTLQRLLDPVLMEHEGRLFLGVGERPEGGTRPDFPVVFWAQVLVDGEVIAESNTWAELGAPSWTDPAVFTMDRRIGGAQVLAQARDRAQVRILSNPGVARMLYMGSASRWPDPRCWTGEFTVPARWESSSDARKSRQ